MFKNIADSFNLESLQDGEFGPFIPPIDYSQQLPEYFSQYQDYTLEQMDKMEELNSLKNMKLTKVGSFTRQKLTELFPSSDEGGLEFILISVLARGVAQANLANASVDSDQIRVNVYRTFLMLKDIAVTSDTSSDELRGDLLFIARNLVNNIGGREFVSSDFLLLLKDFLETTPSLGRAPDQSGSDSRNPASG